MVSLYYLILALASLLAAFWLLDRHRWARPITRQVKKLSWFLVKGMLKLLVKLLRKVASLFDPY